MVSFGDTVNFFLIVIQETPLFNQHTLFSSLRGRILDDEDETVLPPPCRAFSAMIDASGIPSEDANHSEGPDMSSPATQAYAKRQLMPPHPSQAGVH